MKSNIKTLMDMYAFDNNDNALEAGMTIAEHMEASCDATDWSFFFDEDPEQITSEMVEEARTYLYENWDINLESV